MIGLALTYGALVGLSLGLTGGGGSIFAVPLLVYLLGYPFRLAVPVSLAVVGTTALYGAMLQAKRGNIVWGAGAILGLGGIVSSPLGASIGQTLPEPVSLTLFAVLMLIIGGKMLRGGTGAADVPLTWISCARSETGQLTFTYRCAGKLLVAGAVTGVLTGIFGVGGGFLLLPALLLVPRLSIHQASGTSLVSIVLISLSALASHLHETEQLFSTPSLLFLAGSLGGMTAGAYLKGFLPAARLRALFGALVISTAVAMLVVGR